MASRARTVESARVKRHFNFTHEGTEYRVFETDPKRSQDVIRIELWKEGSDKPYVVSFQDERGDSFGCSCPAGKFRRAHGPCKHVRMCRAEFLTASAQPAAPKTAPKQLPVSSGAQLALVGLSEIDEIEKELAALRAEYATVDSGIQQKKAEIQTEETKLAEILRKGKLLAARLEKARRAA